LPKETVENYTASLNWRRDAHSFLVLLCLTHVYVWSRC